jgi:hypothetical protein
MRRKPLGLAVLAFHSYYSSRPWSHAWHEEVLGTEDPAFELLGIEVH